MLGLQCGDEYVCFRGRVGRRGGEPINDRKTVDGGRRGPIVHKDQTFIAKLEGPDRKKSTLPTVSKYWSSHPIASSVAPSTEQLYATVFSTTSQRWRAHMASGELRRVGDNDGPRAGSMDNEDTGAHVEPFLTAGTMV